MSTNEQKNPIANTERLDWLIAHPQAEFNRDARMYLITYLGSGSKFSDGRAGRFLAEGKHERDCIDAFIRGEIVRID